MSQVLMKDLGFACSAVDHSVFFQWSSDEHTVIVVATDNMAVTSKHPEDIVRFKEEIRRYWEITDNGPIGWFLGFQIKHIDICYHFICEVAKDGKIQVEYIPTDDHVVDIFTKPLVKTKFHHFIELLGDGRVRTTWVVALTL